MTSSVDLDLNWLLCVVSLTYSPLSLFLPLSLSLSLSLFEKRRWYSLRHARGPQCLNHFSCTLLKYCLKPEMKVFVPLQLSLVLQINLTGIMVISSSQEGKVSQSIATECLFVFRAALRHYTRRLQVEPLYGSFWSVHSASRHQAIAYFFRVVLSPTQSQSLPPASPFVALEVAGVPILASFNIFINSAATVVASIFLASR